MLSKAKSEDSNIKTVTLARGTVSTPSIPTSNPMRRSFDRSSGQRSSSPDTAIKGDVSLSSLASIGIVELLEQDERPSLIVDLGDSSNYGAGPLHPLFVNASLRSDQHLLDAISGAVAGSTSSPITPPHKSYMQFKAWLLGAAVDGESLNVCLPSFLHAGMCWSCSTLRKRLRIISGAYMAPRSQSQTTPLLNPASTNVASAPLRPALNASMRGASFSSTHSIPAVVPEEPQDYFGAAAPPATDNKADTLQTSAMILPSTELVGKGDSSSSLTQHDLSPARRITSLYSTDTPMPDTSVSPSHNDARSQAAMELPTAGDGHEVASFDWTRLPVTNTMPEHIQFARSIDWASTALGPIEEWSPDLRQYCNLIMASPHPAAMYWGPDLVAIYNEAYRLLAGQKHPKLMGQSYRDAWAEIWPELEPIFANAIETGEATMKDDDCLFIVRNSYLEEVYFSWSIIPMVGGDGSVMGLYNPAFEKTRRKLAERRMLTLREIGERTASARDIKGFWDQCLAALDFNEYDTPFVMLYSVTDDADSDSSSIYSSSANGLKQCTLEGALGVPEGHQAAPATIDLKTGTQGFGLVFREVMKTDKPVLLEIGSRDLPVDLLHGLQWRGFGDPCRSVIICPIHLNTGESTLGFLVMGINPRRPYDEDYNLFVQLLSRQLATSLASVVLFEEEIRRGQQAAKLAAMDRMELSEQLAARTQEAIESETKFTRMAEFAPVGMFIANPEGRITYCNNTWFDISCVQRDENTPDDHWMDAVHNDDRALVDKTWHDLIVKKEAQTTAFRFKTPWKDGDGKAGDRWALFSAYPEKYESGAIKSVFGSLTDISKQKWAEDFQKRRMEEAVELKRAQDNFIDITSHEMRNPLSAILQCADDISTTMTKLTKDDKNTEPGLKDAVTSAIDSAQTIALCAQHQKRIVDDILTLSKLDSQLLLVTPVDTQPLTVAQRALKMHEGELQTADIQLKFVVDESFKALGVDWVKLDPSRVLQVLINLTTNAIKFTTTERKRTITVTIAASKERPSEMENRLVNYFPTRNKRPDLLKDKDWGNGEEIYIHFAVQDTGRGLNPEEKKMLFIRFSQASPRTHVQYGGSGLGLFISRELTELQGGEIGVASEAGVGSIFAFYVKARRTPPPKDAEAARPRKASDSKGTKMPASVKAMTKERLARPSPTPSADEAGEPLKVLIVEDNLVNQRVLQKQLKNLGCIVHVANHGGEALDVLRRSTYWNHAEEATAAAAAEPIDLSVVLMDQEMPVMDGLTCTRKIRELESEGHFVRHVPIIAVTANARSEQIQTALKAGMDDVVAKPFRIPELIPKIRELMDRFSSES